jgi:thiol-disulfide isomerase/thioredoxin
MKKLPFLFLAFIPTTIYTQEAGVQFEQTLSWTEIQAKAKAENKYIFLHCYTSYCGPSRYMSTIIYPTKEAGKFMSDKFISIKLQLDTTDKDNAQVKSWYKNSHEIAETYNVRASPTYMIFDPEGKPVHRFTGQVQTTSEFIEKTKDAFDPTRQYFAMLTEYKNGRKDSAFLHKMAIAVIAAYDTTNIKAIVNDFLNTQTNLYTRENLGLLEYVTTTSHDRGFRALLKDPGKVNEILGKGVAERRTYGIIISEEVLQKYNDGEPDWNAVTATIKQKYPSQANEVIAKSKFIYYANRQDWNQFQYAMIDYMKKYEAKVSPGELNDYAWAIFQNCNDMNCVAEALKWSEHSFNDNNQPAFMDTYANILYKLGRKQEAITWETKAMELSPEADRKIFKDTIEKMRNGEKTWK